MLEMIELLRFDPGNTILFQHLTANHGSETSEELEFLLEAFVEGYLSFKQSYKQEETEEKIKRLLSENIVKDTKQDTEQLYQRFLNTPDVFDAALIDSIKHCIYDAVVSELAESAPDFIFENTICKNFLSVHITEASWLSEDERFTTWWYLSESRTQTERALKEDPLFKGVVLSKRYEFASFVCAFDCYETAEDYSLRLFMNSEKHEIADLIFKLIEKYELEYCDLTQID